MIDCVVVNVWGGAMVRRGLAGGVMSGSLLANMQTRHFLWRCPCTA